MDEEKTRQLLEEAMGKDVCEGSGIPELVAVLTSQRDNARNAEDVLTPKTDLAKLQMAKKLLLEVSGSMKTQAEGLLARYGELSQDERWKQTNSEYLRHHLKDQAEGHLSYYIGLVEGMK